MTGALFFARALIACTAIVVCIFTGACTPLQDNAADSAPPYFAVALEGDSVSLAARRGSVVLLNIWATWCPPCREEMPMLQRLHDSNRSRGFEVVGVSIDARGEDERVKRFVNERKITFPIWLDPDDRASFLFRAIGVPASFLIDREGRVAWKKLGPVSEQDATLTEAIEKALAQRRPD